MGKVPWRTTLKAGWPVFVFVIAAMVLLVAFAPYTPAIPAVLLLWVVAFVVLMKLGRRLRRSDGP
jgi:hypothetical protein